VLEVGLGGRLDATNAVRAEVAVVTGVAMDHAAILGDTLAKIALEKAGIFKPHQRVVIGVSGEPAAVPVLIDAAQRVLARLSIVGEHDLAKVRSHRGWRHGEVQQRNAANAIVAVAALDQGAAAFELAALNPPPGRFEVIEEDDLDLVLDGAHNPHAAAALAGELRARGIEPVVIIAASSDKDVAGIAAALAPVARGVIATRYQQDRAMAPDALAAIMRTAVGVERGVSCGGRAGGDRDRDRGCAEPRRAGARSGDSLDPRRDGADARGSARARARSGGAVLSRPVGLGDSPTARGGDHRLAVSRRRSPHAAARRADRPVRRHGSTRDAVIPARGAPDRPIDNRFDNAFGVRA
jgi:hypothetical protein